MNLFFEKYFNQAIDNLKAENRFRTFTNISRICGEFPYAINNNNGKKIVIWCSNDYLGMGQNPQAISSAKKALDLYGVGAGGTRNISGNNALIENLEDLIAKHHCKEAGLVFGSGYSANDGTIQALAKIIPNLTIFSDKKNHASIISGIKHSGLTKHVFAHNDLQNLTELLQNYSLNHPKIIIFESVYSMDGDFGKIQEIVEIAKKFNALTYIDEVHAVGLYGKTGAGLSELLNLQNQIDIIQGTFAKGYGAIGGYITAKENIIKAIRSFASPFIFSTSMPPAILSAITNNVQYLQNSDVERKILFENVAKVKNALLKNNIKIFPNDSHIISVMVGDPILAKNISQKLLDDFNIYIQHINYPTVAKGDERLRITPSALHNDQMIADLISHLTQIFKEVV
ncbi:MAG: 5-aminolevulinate synthase [Alphaproteobacteria bacterium]